jgi:hypothetical protein
MVAKRVSGRLVDLFESLSRWQSADGSFTEILPFNAEGMGESSSIIFPRNNRGKFYQFGLVKSLAQTRKEQIGYLDRSIRYAVGVFENNALKVGEIEIGTIAVEIGDLLGCDSGFSANGRSDVNSKWTADKSSNTEFGKPFQLMVNQMAAHLGSFHLDVSPKDLRMMRGHLDGHNDAA